MSYYYRKCKIGELACKKVCSNGICPLRAFCDRIIKIDFDFRREYESKYNYLVPDRVTFQENYVCIYEKFAQLWEKSNRAVEQIKMFDVVYKEEIIQLNEKIIIELKRILDGDAPDKFQDKPLNAAALEKKGILI